MLEAEANIGGTILDYLNEDCWRAVFAYVPLGDVIRSEQVSRRWQEIVSMYLQQGIYISVNVMKYRSEKAPSKVCHFETWNMESFQRWTSKLGSSVVASYCDNWESLKIIGANCPNLEALRLVGMANYTPAILPTNGNEDFRWLQQMFLSSCHVSDMSLCHFVGLYGINLEVLEIDKCPAVTGEFLNIIHLQSLGSLVFDSCKLRAEHFISAVESLYLGELKHLKLPDSDMAEGIHLVLDFLPKLEHLEIYSKDRCSMASIKPLCSLRRLKHLKTDFKLRNQHLEAVMESCMKLESLELRNCECLTSLGGPEALARHGAKLSSLTLLDFHDLDDDAVLTVVRGCHNLRLLTLEGSGLSPSLPARAHAAWRDARPRPRPRPRLQLDLSRTNLKDDEFLENDYEDEDIEEMRRQCEEMRTRYGLVIALTEEGIIAV